MTSIKPQYSHDDYELIDRKSCFKGFFALDKFSFKHKRFDGSWSRVVEREVFVRGDATCVLPYDPIAGKIILLEQFRAGALLANQSPWLIELVAGINEKGELPEDVARREAVEEAGIELLDMKPIIRYLPSPGGATEEVHLYCALVDSEGAGGVYGLPEEDEDIKVHLVDVSDIASLLASGEINNSPAIIALQWLLLHKKEIDQEWKPKLEKARS